MAVSRLILILMCGLGAMHTHGEAPAQSTEEAQTTGQSQTEGPDLPGWTGSHDEPNLFVVETKDFSTHFDVTNGVLPAIRAGVKRWAQRSIGSDCGEVIDSIPLDDFRDLIHKDQEHIHEFRRFYDAETAKQLEAEYDIYYRGYVRVNVNDKFRNQLQKRLDKQRLKRRLCTTLVVALIAFGLAAIGWAYLFANRVSRGFYISRLRWAAGGLVVTLLFVCYSISKLLF